LFIFAGSLGNLNLLLVCFSLLAGWVFLLLGASAGLMLDLFFILVSPCAGRHSLSLLRQRK
jgi:hypothetical protein